MSARTTGATESQIEAAAKRMHDIRSERNKLPHPQVWPCAGCMGSADAWADCLVRPDQRIVEAADLAELLMTSWIVRLDDPEHVATVARLRALL